MIDFSFENLSSKDFAQLAKDLIEETELYYNKRKVLLHTFRENRDGGIDFKDKQGDIHGQAKRYTGKFPALYRTLKVKDLPAVHKIKPKRYILVTSLTLSNKDKEKIIELFDPYILSIDDILGKENLNNLLNKFDNIAIKHLALFPTHQYYAKKISADSPEKRLIRKESELELEKARLESKLFVSHEGFKKALTILRKNAIVVITGLPGIGKSILGRALTLHYLEKEHYEEFICIKKYIKDGKIMLENDRKQVFFFDDFLGDIDLYNRASNETIDFFEQIKGKPNKILILTTREYVLKKGKADYNKLEDIDTATCSIDIEQYTDNIKRKILYNHLKYSDLDYNIIKYIANISNFESIVFHRSYSPRLIAHFTQKQGKEITSGRDFLEKFKQYLNNPYDYWYTVMNKQQDISKMILLILLASNAPVFYDDLLISFKNVCAYKELTKKGFEEEDLIRALNEINDTFIFYNETFLSGRKVIEFINPSIKDFLLEYLRSHQSYIEQLIKGAVFFNQLFYIFSTREDEKIESYDDEEFSDDDEPEVYGKKIQLSVAHQKMLLDKVVQDFNTLKTNITRRTYLWGNRDYDKIDEADSIVQKLLNLIYEFDFRTNAVFQQFIRNQIEGFNFWDKPKKLVILEQDMIRLPTLIKRIKDIIYIDPIKFISAYYNNVATTSELYQFTDLATIFPEAYKSFFKQIKKELRQKIKEVIEYTVDMYMESSYSEDEVSLEILLHDGIDTLYEHFGLKVSETFRKKIYRTANFTYPDSQSRNEQIKEQPAEEKKTAEETAVSPMTLLPPAETRFDLENTISHIHKQVGQSSFEIVGFVKSNQDKLRPLLHSPEAVDCLIAFLQHTGTTVSFENSFQLYEAYYNFLIGQLVLLTDDVSNGTMAQLVYSTVFELYMSDSLYYRKSRIEEAVKQTCHKLEVSFHFVENIISESSFLFTKKGIWYVPLGSSILYYGAAKYISQLPQKEKIDFYASCTPNAFTQDIFRINIVWFFLSVIDAKDFNTHFLLMHLKMFNHQIKGTKKVQVFKSIVDHFDINLELCAYPNDKKIHAIIYGTSTTFLLFSILMYVGMPLDLNLLNNYLKAACTDMANEPYYHALVEDIKKNKESAYETDTDNHEVYYCMRLSRYTDKEGFIEAMKKYGFFDNVLELHKSVKQKVQELEK